VKASDHMPNNSNIAVKLLVKHDFSLSSRS